MGFKWREEKGREGIRGGGFGGGGKLGLFDTLIMSLFGICCHSEVVITLSFFPRSCLSYIQ